MKNLMQNEGVVPDMGLCIFFFLKVIRKIMLARKASQQERTLLDILNLLAHLLDQHLQLDR